MSGAIALIAAAVLVTASPLSAQAQTLLPSQVTAGGSPLDGSVQKSGSFTLDVVAPAGVTVKFKMDGVYLGQDSSAPYSWPISTGSGAHRVNVRWDDSAGRQSADVAFSVGTETTKPAPAPAPAPAPSSTPTPSPAPAPAPSSAPTSPSIAVATSAQLTAALKAAKPGQTIVLKDGTYSGKFVASPSGTDGQRISLTGSRKAVITTGSTSSGYALNVTGDYWNITGLTISGASKGIVLDGSNRTVIDGVDVGRTGAEAVHVRTSSSHVIVRNSVIHDTGLVQPSYGEGIYVGSAKSNWSSIMGSSSTPDRSDYVQILTNVISNTSAEGIDIKEGTTGGIVSRNTFINAGYSGENYADSWVDVKGNDYQITGNTGTDALLDAFQVHVIDGWGQKNAFRGNAITGRVPGYEVSVQSGANSTSVGCASSAASRGLSNIACTR